MHQISCWLDIRPAGNLKKPDCRPTIIYINKIKNWHNLCLMFLAWIHIRIRIEKKGWIRIRKKNNVDPQKNL